MKMHCVVLTCTILAAAAQPRVAKEQFSMAVKIESKRYCEVDHKKASLVMKFSVALKNSASATLTMRQPIHVLPLVAPTLQDLQHGKYEMTLYAPEDCGLVKPGDKVPEIETASRQTNVKPGEAFTGETVETEFPVALTAKFPKWEALEPGSHFVQLVLDSEIQGTGTFVEFRSQPIEITVDKHPKVEKCL